MKADLLRILMEHFPDAKIDLLEAIAAEQLEAIGHPTLKSTGELIYPDADADSEYAEYVRCALCNRGRYESDRELWRHHEQAWLSAQITCNKIGKHPEILRLAYEVAEDWLKQGRSHDSGGRLINEMRHYMAIPDQREQDRGFKINDSYGPILVRLLESWDSRFVGMFEKRGAYCDHCTIEELVSWIERKPVKQEE